MSHQYNTFWIRKKKIHLIRVIFYYSSLESRAKPSLALTHDMILENAFNWKMHLCLLFSIWHFGYLFKSFVGCAIALFVDVYFWQIWTESEAAWVLLKHSSNLIFLPYPLKLGNWNNIAYKKTTEVTKVAYKR